MFLDRGREWKEPFNTEIYLCKESHLMARDEKDAARQRELRDGYCPDDDGSTVTYAFDGHIPV